MKLSHKVVLASFMAIMKNSALFILLIIIIMLILYIGILLVHGHTVCSLFKWLYLSQRRLRHVRSLCVRNLATPEHVTLPLFPLDIKLRFTLHRTDNSNIGTFVTPHSLINYHSF